MHYGIQLDAQCKPIGQSPLFAYWRMKEKGASVTEQLLSREQAGYGLGPQSVELTENGAHVKFIVRALSERPILLDVQKTEAGCTATPWIVIGDGTAKLFNIHVNVSWPFGIGSVVMTGYKKADGSVVREKIAK